MRVEVGFRTGDAARGSPQRRVHLQYPSVNSETRHELAARFSDPNDVGKDSAESFTSSSSTTTSCGTACTTAHVKLYNMLLRWFS